MSPLPRTGPATGLRRRTVLGAALAPPALIGVAGLAACDPAPGADHTGADAPLALPLTRPGRTAWVFSSGGPRGYVHVGVVQALEELGLKPDLIVGASAGAVIGVLCAAGLGGARLREQALDLHPLRFARMAATWPPRLSGRAIGDWLRGQIDGRRLQELPVAVACVARRPQRGDVVAFTAGDAGVAVQAATAIEGQFAPVRIGGEWHADADLAQPLPVRLARALGAQRVLAIDASAHEDKAPPGTEPWREGDLRKRALTAPDARAADLLLHPDIGYYAGIAREWRERVIEIGYRETLAAEAALRRLHAA